jgi:hypothetical protein
MDKVFRHFGHIVNDMGYVIHVQRARPSMAIKVPVAVILSQWACDFEAHVASVVQKRGIGKRLIVVKSPLHSPQLETE